jgi:hypothetical protein
MACVLDASIRSAAMSNIQAMLDAWPFTRCDNEMRKQCGAAAHLSTDTMQSMNCAGRQQVSH